MRKPDDIDRRIIEILRWDARTPFTNIGIELGEGIIKRHTIDVDKPTACGRMISDFLFMNEIPGAVEEVAKQLVENEEVSAIYEIHGPNDLILKIEASDFDEIRDTILKIREIPNVVASELTPVFKIWRDT